MLAFLIQNRYPKTMKNVKDLLAHLPYRASFSGELLGVITFIQDLKPVLASYLNESGQAIVGWSDVTSGPSSSNPIFDD